jgi:DNA processing protein
MEVRKVDERSVLIGLHEIEGIGRDTIERLHGVKGGLTTLLDQRKLSKVLNRVNIIGKKAEAISTFLTKERIESKLRFYEQCEIKLITRWDQDYPYLLAQISDPPWVLYAKGNVNLLHRACIAVVGMRDPSPYGREAAEWIGSELALAGAVVVSGLARGIDSYAHVGALRHHGSTIAVLGNGLNVHYPPEHHELQQRIAVEGLVISEYPWNLKPAKGTFLMRNRIIAGITLGTVVVEAAEGSGSLHTADCALAFNRNVFGVPGPITSWKSAGVNARIREGAALVTDPRDILIECNIETLKSKPSRDVNTSDLNESEQLLLHMMGAQEVTIDELIARTHQSLGQIHTVLLSLLVKKRIRSLSGSTYIARMN